MNTLRLHYDVLASLIAETVSKSLLIESASPIVWHFTTPEAMVEILESDSFILSCADELGKQQNMNLTGYREKSPYYFSTTRSKNSHDGFSKMLKKKSSIGCVRIQLDGEKLNHNYHAKAGNFHGKDNQKYSDSSIKGRFTDNFTDGYYKLSDIKNDKAYAQDEKEDTIWSPTEEIQDATKYIQRIDVLVYESDNEFINELKEYEDEGYPIYFYSDEDSFNAQNDNYFNGDELFEKRLKQALEDMYNGRSIFYIFDTVDEETFPGYTLLGLEGRYNLEDIETGDLVSDEWYENIDDLYQFIEN